MMQLPAAKLKGVSSLLEKTPLGLAQPGFGFFL
jgi:hypothetical protein